MLVTGHGSSAMKFYDKLVLSTLLLLVPVGARTAAVVVLIVVFHSIFYHVCHPKICSIIIIIK